MSPTDIGLRDLWLGVQNIPLAISLAQRELQTRYSRTTLGPLWITLAQAIWIGGVAFVFSQMFGQNIASFGYFLAAGMPVWTYISTTMSEAPSTFVAGKGALEQFNAPWTVQVWKRVAVNAWVFAQHMLIWVAALALVRPPMGLDMLYALPGLAILFGTGWGAMLLFGVLGARYRDLQPALVAGMSFLFVLTPVFWDPQMLPGDRPMVTHFNPFYHFLEIVRSPLIGRDVALESWIVCITIMVLVITAGCVAFTRARRSLFNWL